MCTGSGSQFSISNGKPSQNRKGQTSAMSRSSALLVGSLGPINAYYHLRYKVF